VKLNRKCTWGGGLIGIVYNPRLYAEQTWPEGGSPMVGGGLVYYNQVKSSRGAGGFCVHIVMKVEIL